jgi:excisionase family DNA binding protein
LLETLERIPRKARSFAGWAEEGNEMTQESDRWQDLEDRCKSADAALTMIYSQSRQDGMDRWIEDLWNRAWHAGGMENPPKPPKAPTGQNKSSMLAAVAELLLWVIGNKTKDGQDKSDLEGADLNHANYGRLSEAFRRTYSFDGSSESHRAGRTLSDPEVYALWAKQFVTLGNELREQGWDEWAVHTVADVDTRQLLIAAIQGDEASLAKHLARLGNQPPGGSPPIVRGELSRLHKAWEKAVKDIETAEEKERLLKANRVYGLLHMCVSEAATLWTLATSSATNQSQVELNRDQAKECYAGRPGDTRPPFIGFAAHWKNLEESDTSDWQSLLTWDFVSRFAALCETCIKLGVPWVTGWARLRQGIDAWKPAPSFQEMHAELDENLELLGDGSGAVHLPKATEETLASPSSPEGATDTAVAPVDDETGLISRTHKSPPAIDDPIRLTITEVARYVGVSDRTIREWRDNGKLPAIQDGDGNLLFSKSTLNVLRDSRPS